MEKRGSIHRIVRHRMARNGAPSHSGWCLDEDFLLKVALGTAVSCAFTSKYQVVNAGVRLRPPQIHGLPEVISCLLELPDDDREASFFVKAALRGCFAILRVHRLVCFFVVLAHDTPSAQQFLGSRIGTLQRGVEIVIGLEFVSASSDLVRVVEENQLPEFILRCRKVVALVNSERLELLLDELLLRFLLHLLFFLDYLVGE